METTINEVGTTKESRYRRAKTWQIGAFALNNSATNIFMFLMMYVSYYATGVVGLGTVIVSTLITMSRIWDGITDPIIGLWIIFGTPRQNGFRGESRAVRGHFSPPRTFLRVISEYKFNSQIKGAVSNQKLLF